jgi:putative ABC transport system permease protein
MFKRHSLHALRNITNHKPRSFLTLLGIWVGTAAIVALLTGSKLATQSALAEFRKLGVDLIGLSLSDTSSNLIEENFLSATHQELLKDMIEKIVPYTLHYSSVDYNHLHLDSSIIGTDEGIFSILKQTLLIGRFVSHFDKATFYCMLGYQVAKQLNSIPEALVGEQVMINKSYFTIIGVLKESDKNLFLNADSNESIIIPLAASFLLYDNTHISHIIFKLKPHKKVREVQKSLESLVRSRNPETQLYFRSPETIIVNMEKQQRTFNLLLSFIGGIALLVGGIGVMNIMLVSVTERKREIGIRMAVGACKKDILYLFLLEAGILTLVGGLAGILSGEIISYATAKGSHWEYHFIFAPVAIGFFVSVLVGLFSGIYPAKKAASLDPIEALRAP